MLATMGLLWRCYGVAMAVPLLLRRGHIGAGPLERVFPAGDDLGRPEKSPRSARGLAELLEVMVRDVAPALPCLGKRAQEDAVSPGHRDAATAPSNPEYKGELGGRHGHPQSQRNLPALVADFERFDRIGAEFLALGRVEQPRLSVSGEGAVDLAEEAVGEL